MNYSIDIDGLRGVGLFFVFAKYVLPLFIGVALIAIALWAFSRFTRIRLNRYSASTLLVAALILALILT